MPRRTIPDSISFSVDADASDIPTLPARPLLASDHISFTNSALQTDNRMPHGE
jgi:hypothetical protein